MTLTTLFMILIVLIIAVMDIYLIKKKGKPYSFSAYIIRYVNYNRLAFFTTLGVGIVMGHVFWSMKTEDIYKNVECKEVKHERSENKIQ